jgi:hypothetical protein
VKIIRAHISGVTHLGYIACIKASNIDRRWFVSTYADLDVRNVYIHIDVEHTTVVVAVHPKITRRIAGDLGRQLNGACGKECNAQQEVVDFFHLTQCFYETVDVR